MYFHSRSGGIFVEATPLPQKWGRIPPFTPPPPPGKFFYASV